MRRHLSAAAVVFIFVMIGRAGAMLPDVPDATRFSIIGDSGTGERPEYDVATRLAEYHTRLQFSFVLMLGDNIYGSERPQDFERKFAIPFKPLLDADVKFYATLGNHDDRDSGAAGSRQALSRHYCSVVARNVAGLPG